MIKNVLVTGGAGYVGSHACKALARAGYRPVTYDNLSRGHEWAVRWGPLERGDLADSGKLKAALKKYKPAAVLHFAAVAYAGESVTDPSRYYGNNIVGSWHLLNAMVAAGVRNLIFSGSCSVYGDYGMKPIPESAPFQPVSPYGFTKMAVERMAQDFSRAYGTRVTSLRYFNAAGADPEGELGEDHDPETHLLPIVLEVARGLRKELDIYGSDYPTPDGTCVRDYIHVADLADAHVLALDKLVAGGEGGAFNLGTGRGYSVRDAVHAAERVTGKKVRVAVRSRREGDPAYAVADATLARKALGWTPKFTSLEKILRTAWQWLEHGGAAQYSRKAARGRRKRA